MSGATERSMDSRLERVLYEEPLAESRASLVLLKKDLLRKVAYHGYQGWLRFRWEVLHERLAASGQLTCLYCGKGPLIIEADDSEPLCASLDHVHPVSQGGSKWDRNNLVVACIPCNQSKKDKPLDVWLEERKRLDKTKNSVKVV